MRFSPLEWGLWTSGKDTFLDELAQIVGLTNAFSDVTGWAEISQEQVLERDPDYIVTTAAYYGEGELPVDEIALREGWQDLRAVKNGAIYNADADMTLPARTSPSGRGAGAGRFRPWDGDGGRAGGMNGRTGGIPWYGYVLLIALVAVTLCLCVSLGSVAVPFGDTAGAIWSALWGLAPPEGVSGAIILNVRLPRVLATALCGAALSLCGAAMQGLLRNPLADGSTLGVSSGASLGARDGAAAGPFLSRPSARGHDGDGHPVCPGLADSDPVPFVCRGPWLEHADDPQHAI